MLYGAYPPEVNSAKLTFGPGAGPMLATAAAYEHIADGLLTAAAASDGQTESMGVTWTGESALKAQLAFRKHADWLREQGVIAMSVAQHALVQADAYAGAVASMPSLPAILAVRATTAALVATNNMGQNTPAIAANELIYLGMWVQAAGTMYAYHAETLANAASLPPPPPAPEIVSPSPQGVPPDFKSGPDGGPGFRADPAGPTGPTDTTGPHTSGPTQDTANPGGDNGTQAPAQPDQPPVDPNGGNPSPDVQETVSDPMQTLSDAPYGTDGLIDGTAQDVGFFGTSPGSSTLSGLGGGMAGMAAIGLVRGGLGSIPGGANGFRMPTNWSLGKGTAFGASPNNGAATGPPARKGPPRGAIAPKTGRRRRKDEKSDKPAAVFVPGEPQEVPVLEKPPVIGVIEYVDEPEPRLDDSDAHHVNVLGEHDRGYVNAS